MKKLRKFVENPYVNVFIGLILLLSGLYEAWGTLYEDAISANFGTNHGVIIFGLFHVLKQIPDMFEGLDHIAK